MSVDKRPARQDRQKLQRSELISADAGSDDERQYAGIERDKDGDKALFEEALEVVLLCLEAGVQTVAREEKEYTDEEDAEF